MMLKNRRRSISLMTLFLTVLMPFFTSCSGEEEIQELDEGIWYKCNYSQQEYISFSKTNGEKTVFWHLTGGAGHKWIYKYEKQGDTFILTPISNNYSATSITVLEHIPGDYLRTRWEDGTVYEWTRNSDGIRDSERKKQDDEMGGHGSGSGHGGSDDDDDDDDDDDGWLECMSCDGTGLCPRCKGTGLSPIVSGQLCAACNGTGLCSVCDGEGGYY